MLHPVGENSLIWDDDWRPEGTAFAWETDQFFADGIGTWLESDSAKNTELAWLAQAGFKASPGDNAQLRAGVGYHQINAAGHQSFFGDNDFFGNSCDPVTQTYLYDYHGLEGFAELGFHLFDHPATAYADVVRNQAAPQFDTGYIFGLKLGSAKDAGNWELGWAYEDLEADAVLGLLTDSDFGGGGTDAKGHILTGTYAIRKNFNTKFTYFINQMDGNLGQEKDFDRLQLDLNFKF